MKIVFVSDAVYPYNKGGKEKRLFDLSTQLAARGFDVHIYCMKWWQGPEWHRVEHGVHLHAICPYVPLYSGERRSIRQALLFGLSCLRLLFVDWDVIDVDHMPFYPVILTRVVCWLKGKKMIATWHEVWGRDYWLTYLGTVGHMAYLVERFSAHLPDRISSISAHTTDRLSRMFGRTPPVTTIPNGILVQEIEQIAPSTRRTDLIFAGRILRHKNLDLLLAAVKLLQAQGKQVMCTIIGDGPEKQNLQQLSLQMGLADQVIFEDFLHGHEEVLGRFKSSSIFVFPSEREGFGLVALEANACGIPVVTLDHPGNNARTLITEKSGRLCAKDPQSLADAIEDLLHEDRAELRKHCVAHARGYDWERRIDEFVEFYTRV